MIRSESRRNTETDHWLKSIHEGVVFVDELCGEEVGNWFISSTLLLAADFVSSLVRCWLLVSSTVLLVSSVPPPPFAILREGRRRPCVRPPLCIIWWAAVIAHDPDFNFSITLIRCTEVWHTSAKSSSRPFPIRGRWESGSSCCKLSQFPFLWQAVSVQSAQKLKMGGWCELCAIFHPFWELNLISEIRCFMHWKSAHHSSLPKILKHLSQIR